MKLYNTGDEQVKPSVVMLVYGEGGVGKTTFASTADKPIMADCENGAKYFGLRGIKMDIAIIQKWADMREFLELARKDEYDTIVIDPLGELMDKLKRFMVATGDSKLAQKDGNPTMAGWGWLKKTMKDYLKILRDTGKHVILVAHIDELKDEDRIIKRPKIETKLVDDIVNMVDIVAYMTVVKDDGEDKRVLFIDPSSDKYTAKDRTGRLGRIVEPDFKKIINAVQDVEDYAWSKKVEKVEIKIEAPKPMTTGTAKVAKVDTAKTKLEEAKNKVKESAKRKEEKSNG